MPDALDILILGGGLVGCSLAAALDGKGYSLGLVEASAPQLGPPGFDERKLALAEASLHALRALDVLPRLATPPCAIQRIHASRVGDFGSLRWQASDYGREAFGGVVLARELGQALEARADAVAGLQRWRPARMLGLSYADDGLIEVEIDGAQGRQRLRTRLLVGADGTRSTVRQALGIGTQEHDYEQSLFVAALACDRPSDGTAYERLSDEGPVALLPMHGGQYGAVCGVARAQVDAVAALDDAAYAAYFQQRFGWRAGRVQRVGSRSHYPLQRCIAQQISAPRALLMGNAAQTLHPIGAQGFNLGLRDALCLAERLDVGDPGAPKVLADYAEARREDRERTLAFSDGLARFSATPGVVAHSLRSLGLLALSHVPGLAAPLIAGAMGYRGRVPALARGQA